MAALVVVGGLVAGPIQAQPASPSTASVSSAGKPVNLSRLLGGATVQGINAQLGTLTSVAGLSAAIDDDASSGWAPPVGKTLLLLSFPQDADVSAVTVFAPGAKGSYSLSVASTLEAALDPASRTTLLSADFDTHNNSQAIPDVRARFIVLELDVTESAPIRSIDVVGRPATTTAGQVTVVTPQSAEQNAGKNEGQIAEVNFAATTLGAKVATPGDEPFDVIIDGDTGTATELRPTGGKPATAGIHLAAAVEVDRISLAFTEAVGTVSFLATASESPDGRLLGEVKLDGTSRTLTLETPGISAESITVVWTPADGNSPLTVAELGVFALARIVRTAPEPDGSSSVSVQPVFSSGPGWTPLPPPSKDPVPKNPPPILPPAAAVSG